MDAWQAGRKEICMHLVSFPQDPSGTAISVTTRCFMNAQMRQCKLTKTHQRKLGARLQMLLTCSEPWQVVQETVYTFAACVSSLAMAVLLCTASRLCFSCSWLMLNLYSSTCRLVTRYRASWLRSCNPLISGSVPSSCIALNSRNALSSCIQLRVHVQRLMDGLHRSESSSMHCTVYLSEHWY